MNNIIINKLREIRYLSKLNHKNIIRYHTSWIESSNIQVPLLDANINNTNNFDMSNVTDISNDSSIKFISEYNENLTSNSENCLYENDFEITEYNTTSLKKYTYLFLQMEIMEGTFKEWYIINKNSRKKLYLILKGVLDGLEYLHTHDPPLIHCDIKPENILIKETTEKMSIKIADFGLVCILNGDWNPSKYEGTFTYRAPEISNNQKITSAVDIYSLGILLYELTISYNTEMERYDLISKFKKRIIKTNSILDIMIDINPNNRPTIKMIRKYINKQFNNYKY